jgi:glycosyltransferase involved in cell wall biosynthesis
VKKIVILTLEYPFGNGESFLASELEFYSKQSIKVYLVPFKSEGQPRQLPQGISLFVQENNPISWIRIFSKVIVYRWFWKEAIKFFIYFFFKSSRISFLFFIKAAVTQQQKLQQLKTQNLIGPSDTVLYSYWLGGLTGGAILFNRQFSNSFETISRAHGGDVYEYRFNPPYIPFRDFVLKNVTRVAAVSQDGAQYLATKYSIYMEKVQFMYLGTNDPEVTCRSSKDGVLRIVSCAFVSPVKRLHLIAEALLLFQNQHPEVNVHWTHLGGGAQLKGLIDASRPLNKTVTSTFIGNQTQKQIIEFYAQNPVDIFVNTSSSEGMPVSVMEAMSVGIPILATNVGGLKEMVDESCGELFPSDFSPQLLSDKIFVWAKSNNSEKRINSKTKWKSLFDAQKNFKTFYEWLVSK